MFVSGVGGTRKSFLIATIQSLVGHLWPTDNLTCAVAAPTGLATFNVGGVTIHRLFQLPVDHKDSWILGSVKSFPKGDENHTP